MPIRLSLAARRALTTLFASFALLCAQLAPIPETTPVKTGTSIAAGHAKAQVARLSGALTLATAERAAAPHAKSAPPLDAILGSLAALPARTGPAVAASAAVAVLPVTTVSSPYRARAPPLAALSATIFQLL